MLPPPLMTSDPNSFARSTIVERKPQIIRRVLAENEYPPAIVAALHAFAAEIAGETVRPLSEEADDTADWNRAWQRYEGRTWLELPWYFAETFFYRRLLEAVRYLQPGPWAGRDPFAAQKRRQEQEALAQLAVIWPSLDALKATEPELAFEALLHSALWGNRADLSNLTVQVAAQVGLAVQAERQHLLIDHTARLLARLQEGLQRLDIIGDNVGLDVLGDLALADFVLGRGWVEQVVMHWKDRPFFVSDAMVTDVEIALAALRSSSVPALAALGERLSEYRRRGRLHLTTHPFWSSFRTFADLPNDLRHELEAADLRLFKGDVNYRRLLDDRHWPYTTPFEAVAALWRLPCPLVVLRTLKGEIMVGLQPGQAEQLAAVDPDWLIDGQRGVIQWVERSDV
jgi:uncharacterized protein with ATP-grasp and redox domains